MSIERVERGDGSVVWRVRWRQAGRNRSKVLGRKRDAEAFDAEVRRRRRIGELALMDAGQETLAEFGEEWWRLYAEPNLAKTTLKVYASMWDVHILPRLGALRLRELTPAVINRFRLELEADGVGRVTISKSMALLQGVLQRACEGNALGGLEDRVKVVLLDEFDSTEREHVGMDVACLELGLEAVCSLLSFAEGAGGGYSDQLAVAAELEACEGQNLVRRRAECVVSVSCSEETIGGQGQFDELRDGVAAPVALLDTFKRVANASPLGADI